MLSFAKSVESSTDSVPESCAEVETSEISVKKELPNEMTQEDIRESAHENSPGHSCADRPC
jgi:hypothetical protein